MENGRERPLSLIVSWDDFHRHCIQLAHMLESLGKWKVVVGISRGGLVPAGIIARELDIRRVGVLAIASYHDYKTQGGLEVLAPIGKEYLELCPEGEGMVIVDDLVDTGVTFREAAHMYPRAHRAAVFAKDPILYVDTHFITIPRRTWIYLPWDTQPGTLQLRPTVVEEIARLAKKGDESSMLQVS